MRTLSAHRWARVVPWLLVLGLAACGGGGDGPAAPPPRVPASLTFVTPPTGGTVGQVVSAPVVVAVRTADNQPVPNATVTFTVSAGTLASASARTDAQGQATAGAWTLGTVAGPQTLTAAAGAVSGQLTVAAAAGPPTRLEFAAPVPATLRAGVVVTPAPAIRARDQFNNLVTTAARAFTADLTSPTAQLATTGATTDATGTATFAGFAVNGRVGSYTITFGAQGLPPLTATVAVEPGLPAVLVPRNLPTSARAGIAFDPAPTVLVTDRFDNALTRPAVAVTVTVADGGGAVANGSATTDGTGVATFPQLAIEGRVGERRLRLAAEAATLTSAPIQLSAGPAAQLVVASQPTTADNTLPFAQPVRVQVTDRFGNPVGGEARDVAASLASGGGVLRPATARTDGTGLAVFDGLVLIGVIGPRTLAFTAPPLAGATSAPIALAAGPPRQLQFARAPGSSVSSGVPVSPQPIVQLADTSGNLVRRAGLLVRAALLDASGELFNGDAVTDQTGTATFDQLTPVLSGTPAQLRLRFSTGGLAALATGVLPVVPASASAIRTLQIGAAGSRLALVDAGQSLATTVAAFDATNTPISAAGVVFSSSATAVATVAATGTVAGISEGSAWIRAVAPGTGGARDSLFVTVPRDASGPVIRTTLDQPIAARNGTVVTFDVVLDTRGTPVAAANVILGLPGELVNRIQWQGFTGTQLFLDSQFNALRIVYLPATPAVGVVPLVRVTLTAVADPLLPGRLLSLVPVEVLGADLRPLTARATGVPVPLVP
jgi:adhesin/invasin